MQLNHFYDSLKDQLNQALLAPFQANEALNGLLHDSMIYSITNGGKRLRPLLVLATLQAWGYPYISGMASACAVEYIHTYSLVHDDLPAMDDDDYRRGHLSNHKQFDEATAILAGDGLLTYAFECVASDTQLAATTKLQLTRLLAQAAGHQGMLAGQMGDIQAEGQTIDLPTLQQIHAAKTGALILFAVEAGAIIAGADTACRTHLSGFANHYGVAYQIHNDLQEIVWTDEQRGKQAASDAEHDKNTYPALLGTEGAMQALNAEIAACEQALAQIKQLNGQFDVELMTGFLAYLKL